MPDPQLLTRGKSAGNSILTTGSYDQLIETSDYSTLVVEVDMSAAASGDVAVQVNPISEQGDEVFPLSQPAVQSVGPTLNGGRTYFWAQYDVTAQNRVRLRVTNNNAGTQLADVAWRLN